MIRRASLAVALVAAIAGCSDSPSANSSGAAAPASDCQVDCPAAPLDAESTVAAPLWAVGQWWEWQVSFAGEDLPDTFCSIVVTTGPSGHVVATEHATRAKDEAAFDVLLLGAIGPNLEMTRSDLAWNVLSFPLTNGKTWTTTLPNIAWDVLLPAETVDVAMTATFDAALQGYRIMGHVEQGMVIEATYLPETGWFGEFALYDIDGGDAPEEFRMRAVNTGLNYTGPYYLDEATRVVDMYDANGLDNPPPEGQPVLNVDPHVAFTLGADVGSVFGFVEAFAVVGDREVFIAPPGNQEPYQFQATGDLEGAGDSWEIDFPAVAGEWRVATTGAGGHSMAYVQLFSIVEVAGTM